MTLEDARQHSAKIGGDREVPPLVELRRGKAGPIAVNPAAIDGPTQYPDDVAVPVISGPVAVFPEGAAEFGQDDDYGVLPGPPRPTGKGGETLAERAQMIGQLALVIALIDVGIPTTQPDCRNPNARVTADQRCETGHLPGKAGWRRRAVIGDLLFLAQGADQLCTRRPAFAIRSGEVVIAGIEPVEGAGDFRLVDWQPLSAARAERQRRHWCLARENARHGRADADRVGRAA